MIRSKRLFPVIAFACSPRLTKRSTNRNNANENLSTAEFLPFLTFFFFSFYDCKTNSPRAKLKIGRKCKSRSTIVFSFHRNEPRNRFFLIAIKGLRGKLESSGEKLFLHVGLKFESRFYKGKSFPSVLEARRTKGISRREQRRNTPRDIFKRKLSCRDAQ